MECLFFVVVAAIFLDKSSGQLYLQPSGDTQAHFTNDDFVVTCVAPADSGATRLTWEAPHGEIKVTEGRMHVEPVGEEEHSLRLVVLGVIWEDAGQYKCTAVIDGKEVERTFQLIVYRAITFSGTPPEQSATLGEDTTVLCHATAEPKPVIAWSHNGSRITRAHFPRFQQISSGLSIENVSREDEGVYTCKAIAVYSLDSQIRNFNITLRVHYPPEWKDSPMEKAYSSVGSSASLSCEAIAYPPATFEWFKNDAIVETNDNYNITHEPSKSLLHIKVANHSEFGQYICRASNAVGAVERSITLEEGEKPGLPKIDLLRAETNAIEFRLSPPPYNSLPIVGYRLQYKYTNEDWSEAVSQDFDSDDRFIIRHLKPWTEYDVRAAARNAAGLGDYSPEVVHKTSRTMHSAVVTDNNNAASIVEPVNFLFLITSSLLWLRWSLS